MCSIELNVNYSSVRLISALLVIPPLLPNRAREHPERNILSRRKGFQKTYIYIYDTPNAQLVNIALRVFSSASSVQPF